MLSLTVQFAIPGSYIDYDNFSTAEELSAFVHRVSMDRNLYNSYFKWRKHFDVIHAPVADWCQICEALHDKGREPQVYKDLAGWVAQDSCPLYSVSTCALATVATLGHNYKFAKTLYIPY